MNHVETVQAIYAAFGRGDVPAILSHLDADIDWDYGLMDGGAPWLKPRRGRDSVVEFFQALGAVQFTKFEPKTFLTDGNVVVVLLDLGIIVKATGKSVNELDEVHVWRFNEQGLVSRFTHKLDSYQHWAACQGD
ncbi:MAG: nuclear transport factor 2 family protein [Bryobacteraceae bacterium]